MKKIVILFLSFIVIGTISGLLYINKTQPAIEPKPQSNNPQRFVDETSVPPVDIVMVKLPLFITEGKIKLHSLGESTTFTKIFFCLQ